MMRQKAGEQIKVKYRIKRPSLSLKLSTKHYSADHILPYDWKHDFLEGCKSGTGRDWVNPARSRHLAFWQHAWGQIMLNLGGRLLLEVTNNNTH